MKHGKVSLKAKLYIVYFAGFRYDRKFFVMLNTFIIGTSIYRA